MFGILIPIILSIVVGVAGFFGYNQQQDYIQSLEQQVQEVSEVSLGSYYAVGGKYYRLFGSGLTSSATSLILTSFTMPVSDYEFVMGNFGEIGYGTIEPENVSNMEFISFTGITQDGSTEKATLTGVSRGLSFVYPYSASTTLAKSHSGGSRFIISNPPMHYGEYAAKKNAETITGVWTFASTSLPRLDYDTYPTYDYQLSDKGYVDFVTNAGAANISTTTAGIAQIANSEQIKMSTTTGSSGRLLVLYLGQFATSTDKRGASTTAVLTDIDGKIDQSFLDLTEAYTWTGTHTFSSPTTLASTTFTATSTFQLGITVNGTTTFGAIPTLPSNATPTNDIQIASKGYVDNTIVTNLVYRVISATSTSSSTASLIASSNIATTTDSSTYIKAKDIEVNLAGNYYATVDFGVSDGSQLNYVQFYVNDVALIASTTKSIGLDTFDFIIENLVAGDNIQVYYHRDVNPTVTLANFRIYGLIIPTATVIKEY